MNIVCAGDCGIDHPIAEPSRWFGGCTYNIAINLMQLSTGEDFLLENSRWSVAVLSRVGDDPEGALIKQRIEQAWPHSVILVANGPTPVQKIRLAADGERTLCGYAEGVLGTWKLSAEQKQSLDQADLVMIPFFSQFEAPFRQIAEVAGNRKLAVDFMDLSDAPLAGPNANPWLRALAREVPLAYFGLPFPGAKEGAGTALTVEELLKLSAEASGLFVVTLGEGGSLVMKTGKVLARADAEPISFVKNTTGAGDSFAAAFVAAFGSGRTPLECLHAGAARAAKIIAGEATVTGRFP